MGDETTLIDILFLGGALLLILLTSVRMGGRRRRSSRPAEGQHAATIGILIWLLLLGLALYLIFG